jgi:ABC-type sugar transport system ATPase subunit
VIDAPIQGIKVPAKLEVRNINKSFPGVKALNRVNFDLNQGEIHSLVGENGAGKSTLINVVTGQIRPDSGELLLDGKKLHLENPVDAMKKGIGLVPQELNLFPQMTVAENIFWGRKDVQKPYYIDWKKIRKDAQDVLEILDAKLNVTALVGHMSVANQQFVQIARALVFGANILIFDEPTACLTINETQKLLTIITQLRNQGKSIVFISHHMEEVMQISNRASVMRDGCLIETLDKDSFTFQRLITSMAGKEISYTRTERQHNSDGIVLSIRNLTRKNEFEDISFDLKTGEILGIAGLVGAGRTELVSTIFGDRKADSGKILIYGKAVQVKTPKTAIKLGMGYLPEERRSQGIISLLSVRENLSIAMIRRFFKFPRIQKKAEKLLVEDYVSRVRIKLANIEDRISQLSGGNQQKVVLSRWLAMGAKILILDEPTRGIDVLAKDEIHNLIRVCADRGMASLVVSSEMEELINICDRIIIMHEGKSRGIVNAAEVSSEDILHIALK